MPNASLITDSPTDDSLAREALADKCEHAWSPPIASEGLPMGCELRNRPSLRRRVIVRAGAVLVAIAVLGLGPRVADAQSALERLEQAIGQRGRDTTDPEERTDPKETGRDSEALPAPETRSRIQRDTFVDPNLQPYLGIIASDLDRRMATDLDVPVVSGAVIEQVFEGSPAEEAKIPVGAVIVAVNGRRVDRRIDFEVNMSRYRPGEEVTLLMYEGRKLQRKPVRLGGISPESAEQLSRAAPQPTITRQERPATPSDSGELFPPRREESMLDEGAPIPPPEEPANPDQPTRREGPLRIVDRIPGLDRLPIFDQNDPAESGTDPVEPERVEETNPRTEDLPRGELRTDGPELVDEIRRLIETIESQQDRIEQLEQRVIQLEQRIDRGDGNE